MILSLFTYMKATRRTNCSPTIRESAILMSSDLDFMTKEKISEECVCPNKDTCKQIVDLLNHRRPDEAKALLPIQSS